MSHKAIETTTQSDRIIVHQKLLRENISDSNYIAQQIIKVNLQNQGKIHLHNLVFKST